MQIIKKNVLCNTKWVNLVEIDYIDNHGNEKKWTSVERTGDRKAVLIIATVDDKLVVTKEFRVPIGGYEWSFPAGLIDDNESPEAAAIRELKEETNLDVIEIMAISPFAYNTAGLSNESIAMVYLKAKGTPGNQNAESSEDIQTFLMTKEEVKQLLQDNTQKFSAKAWISMQHFASQ